MPEIEGEIQTKKPKALAIENEWYGAFSESTLKNFIKGQAVKITYVTNTKNGKTFNNIKSIEPLGKVITESNNITISKISDTTINTILMISKDLYIDQLKDKTNVIAPFEEVLQEVFDSYNSVIKGKI